MVYAYDPEAVIQDADIEMAELAEIGARIGRLEAAGVCTHESWVGRSATGEIHYPEQIGLSGDQVRCTRKCKQVFANDDALMFDRLRMLELS